MALADALRRLRPDIGITAMGTARGLETTLVPARGYPLELIPPVPLPRRPTSDLLRVPSRVNGAVRRAREVLDRVGADVVVGFGGYVSLPVYLAARGRLPIVIHEANARAGLANRVGARFTKHVAVASPGVRLPHANVVGIPLREAVSGLDRAAVREQARDYFKLDQDVPTLFVFGGSQGARSLNTAVSEAAGRLVGAGIQVLHAIGPKNTVTVVTPENAPRYVVVPYVERMDLAYAAADLVLCRSGAMTCAELAAVGLPAAYVPLPHGNGEQRLNAQPVVDAGGGIVVEDSVLSADWIVNNVVPILTDRVRLEAMSAAAARFGHRDADVVLARMVLEAVEAAGDE